MYLSLIPGEIREKLKEYIPGIHIEDKRIIYNHPKLDEEAVIPSKHYPLSKQSTISLFTNYNTKEVIDDKLAQVFNSMDLPIGRCYSNTLRLAEKCKEQGVSDIKTFVGWIVPPSALPIHHCWLVYRDNHVLDGGIFMHADLMYAQFIQENPNLTIQEYRQALSAFTVAESKKKNAESRTFGRVCPLYWYVGTECNPDDGRDIYNRLIDKFPDHPSYRKPGQNPHGASETQKMFYEQLNKQ